MVMGELPRRGDSGGGVSQPISDTGEPFLTYGVASRMYFTGEKKNVVFQHSKSEVTLSKEYEEQQHFA